VIIVIDASAAVKLVLDEEGSSVARRVWDEAEAIVAPAIALAEVAAAISTARRAGRLDDAGAATAHGAWRELAGYLDLRFVDDSLAEAARQIAERGSVRGMDAIYLAVADELDDPGSPVGLLSFDARPRAAALAAGLHVLPATVSDDVIEP
jgi:predicted nucleic acid-binding protein